MRKDKNEIYSPFQKFQNSSNCKRKRVQTNRSEPFNDKILWISVILPNIMKVIQLSFGSHYDAGK